MYGPPLNRVATVFQAIMRPEVTLAWPLSLIYTLGCFAIMNAFPLVAALSLYLGLTKSFGLRRLSRGLLVGIFVLALGMVVGWELAPFGGARNAVLYIVGSLPLFFALLLSIWTVRPNNDGKKPSKIPA